MVDHPSPDDHPCVSIVAIVVVATDPIGSMAMAVMAAVSTVGVELLDRDDQQ
jgi:hypothetical protein|tara:strand:- start:229 stop:384 length:156 start_codon:yes stop_codon:yes gene_type:complete